MCIRTILIRGKAFLKLLFLFSIWIAFQANGQTMPSLPKTSSLVTCFPDTTGYKMITVGPSGRNYSDLQQAINNAQPGSVLILDAGVSFKGSFSLPNKTGNGWIIIMGSEMSKLPGENSRIDPINTPAQELAMPKIITTNTAGLPCF